MTDAGLRKQSRPHRGRGRLSSIDMLPERATYAISWANIELGKRKLSQTAIHRRFNEMLAIVDLEPVSWSAFSRYSLRTAARERQTTAIYARHDGGMPSVDLPPRLELARTVLLALLIDPEMDGCLIEQAAAALIGLLRQNKVKSDA